MDKIKYCCEEFAQMARWGYFKGLDVTFRRKILGTSQPYDCIKTTMKYCLFCGKKLIG